MSERHIRRVIAELCEDLDRQGKKLLPLALGAGLALTACEASVVTDGTAVGGGATAQGGDGGATVTAQGGGGSGGQAGADVIDGGVSPHYGAPGDASAEGG